MQFFQQCTTLDEVKARYRVLAKEHHPDRGGDLATMQAVNKEYAFACARIAKGENLTQEEVESTILHAEEYRKAVEKIINLEGINIELIGCWIWVSGNTRAHSEYLKSPDNGPKFFWAKKKLMWYFRGEEYKVRLKGKSKEIGEIRAKYGSERITSIPQYKKALQ
jgi:hypothetical protein